MDALFTTFLSPGGMDSPCLLKNSSVSESCLIELDLMNSIDEALRVDYDVNSFKECVEVELPENQGYSEWSDHSNEMYYVPLFALEVESVPCKAEAITTKENQEHFPFTDYFHHQIYHLALQRRVQSLFRTFANCCLQLGSTEYCQVNKDQHYCCNIIIYQNMVNSERCPCDKLEEGDRYCDIHDLVIQDMEINDKHCIWAVYFNSTVTLLKDDNQDQYVVNPCYNELNENIDDSFEIEFSTNYAKEMECALDTLADLRFSCDSDDQDGYFCMSHLDANEDMMCISSDEEEMNGQLFHYNSELILSTSLDDDDDDYDDDILSNVQRFNFKDKYRGIPFKNTSSKQKYVSKYHVNCVNQDGCKSVPDYNIKQKEFQLKKKVHFADSDSLEIIHPLVVWSHAYKESRRSKWIKVAHDRAHFQRRIENTGKIIEPILEHKLCQFSSGIT